MADQAHIQALVRQGGPLGRAYGLERQSRGRFDFGKGNSGVDLLHTRHLAQLVKEETLIRFDVLGDDAKHEVDGAHQNVGIENFGKIPDCGAKFVEVCSPMRIQLNVSEDVRL